MPKHEEIIFIIPSLSDLPVGKIGCADEWCESTEGFVCGCPNCLSRLGLSLCYHVADWRSDGYRKPGWRKQIVSEKTALAARHLIVDGYPGCIDIGEIVDDFFKEEESG